MVPSFKKGHLLAKKGISKGPSDPLGIFVYKTVFWTVNGEEGYMKFCPVS
jgi:hypothetical protein